MGHRIKNSFIIFQILLLSVSIKAQNASESNDVLNQFEQSLAADFEKIKVPFPKEAVLYHYFNTQDFDPSIRTQADRDQLALKEANNYMSYFWSLNTENSNGVVGHGLYAATDYIASKSYGNTLLIIKNNSDSSYYLDLNYKSITFSNNTLNLALKYYDENVSQALKKLSGLDSYFFVYFGDRSHINSKIKKSFLKVFNKLKIVGFNYGFTTGAYINKICFNAKQKNAAFVLFGSPMLGIDPGSMNNSLFKFKVLKRNFLIEDSEEVKNAYFNEINQIEKISQDLIQTPAGSLIPDAEELAKSTINCL